MKASLTLSLLILAAIGLIRWKQNDRLNLAREAQRHLVAEARALGFSQESIATAGKSSFAARRGREDAPDRVAETKAFARDYISFTLEWKAAEKAGQPLSDERRQKWGSGFHDKLAKLDLSLIKVIMAELRASPEIDDERRASMLHACIEMLGEENPDSALALFMDSLDLLKMDGRGQHVINSLLTKWAAKNPLGALEWLRKTGGNYPILMTAQAKAAVVAGTSKHDPKLALGMFGTLNPEERTYITSGLALSAQTADERTALLGALRDFEKNDAELVKRTLGSLANQIAEENFETGSAWLSSVKLSDAEMKIVIENLEPYQTKANTGKWIDWLSDKMSDNELHWQVINTVSHWATEDYRAAGEWISASPDGPVKEAAARSYVRVLTPHEPAAAAQWALTLPAGKDRDELLGNAQAAWHKKDPAAVAAFAHQHGLGKSQY